MLCTSSCCKNWKYTSACPNIHNYLVFEIFWIVLDCSLIRPCSHCVFKHLFMNVEAWVRRKVIVMLVTATEIIEHLCSIFLIYRHIVRERLTYHQTILLAVPLIPLRSLLELDSSSKQMLVTYLIEFRMGYHQLVFISLIASLVVPSSSVTLVLQDHHPTLVPHTSLDQVAHLFFASLLPN